MRRNKIAESSLAQKPLRNKREETGGLKPEICLIVVGELIVARILFKRSVA